MVHKNRDQNEHQQLDSSSVISTSFKKKPTFSTALIRLADQHLNLE